VEEVGREKNGGLKEGAKGRREWQGLGMEGAEVVVEDGGGPRSEGVS
jgi:hypothetical protein